MEGYRMRIEFMHLVVQEVNFQVWLLTVTWESCRQQAKLKHCKLYLRSTGKAAVKMVVDSESTK